MLHLQSRGTIRPFLWAIFIHCRAKLHVGKFTGNPRPNGTHYTSRQRGRVLAGSKEEAGPLSHIPIFFPDLEEDINQLSLLGQNPFHRVDIVVKLRHGPNFYSIGLLKFATKISSRVRRRPAHPPLLLWSSKEDLALEHCLQGCVDSINFTHQRGHLNPTNLSKRGFNLLQCVTQG